MDLIAILTSTWLSISSFLGFGPDPIVSSPQAEVVAPRTTVSAPVPPRSEASERALAVTAVNEEAVSAPVTDDTVFETDRTVEVDTEYVTIYTEGAYRYIESKSIPEHETGQFPNAGNPNTISAQNLRYRVPVKPVYTGAKTIAQLPGVALNGVVMEPGTAERDGSYNIEALQETYNLGLDESNAHVQPTGLYHYHGVPAGLVRNIFNTGDNIYRDYVQVGWAADGFPMYYEPTGDYTSGYELNNQRNNYDEIANGTYTQDYSYTGSGNLDACNGIWFDTNTYAYFLTDEFPYIPRCLNGTADSSFAKGPGSAGGPGGSASGQSGSAPSGVPSQGSTPPVAATNACSSKSSGSSCSFTGGRGETISGTCQSTPGGLACVPVGGPPQR